MKKLSKLLSTAFALLIFTLTVPAQTASITLFQNPTINKTDIVFLQEIFGLLAVVGDAKRLTTGVGVETDPIFSPDGAWLAFTGEYDGSADVYRRCGWGVQAAPHITPGEPGCWLDAGRQRVLLHPPFELFRLPSTLYDWR